MKLLGVVFFCALTLAFLPVAVLPAVVLASPVAPIPVLLVQPDKTTFMAMPYGDEWTNGYETLDGHSIVQDEDGYWTYAVAGSSGELVPGPLRPEIDQPQGIPQHLRPSASSPPGQPATTRGASGQSLAGAVGSQSVLVLLASFSNQGPVGSTAADWNAQFFGATGSVKDFYRESSYGLLTLAPAAESHGTANDGVIGWLNLGYNHPNTKGNTNDSNRLITRNVISAANPYIDYSSYDTNHDGYISTGELHVIVIVAGYETAYGGASAACTPNVWGHSWELGGTVPAPAVDGVVVGGPGGGGYAQFGEWHCVKTPSSTPDHLATIGIMAHEFGHDINWPDLYDVDGTSEGVGEWSIMGSGNWLRTTGYSGSMPAHPDAFLKWYQGWLTPEQATTTRAGLLLQQVETNPRAVLLRDNPAGVDWLFGGHSGSGEYFLLENRQQTGYDAGLKGCGVLIWHIDETRTSTNSANATDARRLVDLEEADGLNHLDSKTNRSDAGDPYPGSANNTVFSVSANPNSRLYGGADSWITVKNIAPCSAAVAVDITVPATMVAPLVNGWNLVSLHLSPASSAITQVLSSISGQYDVVEAYDTASGRWRIYSPGFPPELNDLAVITESMGVWVHTTAATTLTVTGTVPVTSSQALASGWNLVGYPGIVEQAVGVALASLAGQFDVVEAYDPASGTWQIFSTAFPPELNDLTALTPDRGYWIHMTEPGVWRLSGAVP